MIARYLWTKKLKFSISRWGSINKIEQQLNSSEVTIVKLLVCRF